MKTFIILGMHRSATSLVAKGLHSEISMGQELMLNEQGNPEGHYEDMDMVELNEYLLSKAGGSWHKPPSETDILKLKNDKEVVNSIKSLIDKKNELAKTYDKPLWGWKDPRTVITLPLYMPYLINPHFIFILRDPNEIAKSITKRDKFSNKYSFNIAKEYHTRMLNFMNAWYTKQYDA